MLQNRLQTSPPTPKNLYPKFRNHKTIWNFKKKRALGGPQILLGVNISFFCEYKPVPEIFPYIFVKSELMQNFVTLRQPRSGILVTVLRKRED